MMNKRGAILHWIFFGVLLAIGIFLFAGKSGYVTAGPKAAWQLDFLQHNYLEAEKEILKTTIIGRQVGVDLAQELAQHGGFKKNEAPACGAVDSINLWNRGQQNCFPDVDKAISELAAAKLESQMPGKIFEVGYSNTFFYGKGPEQTIRTQYARYTFDNSFYVNLGYSFSEYNQIKQEAQFLLLQCSEKVALCVSEKKPAHWHYLSCTSEAVIPADITEMVFCVESPQGYKINGEVVEYYFGLDFGDDMVS